MTTFAGTRSIHDSMIPRDFASGMDGVTRSLICSADHGNSEVTAAAIWRKGLIVFHSMKFSEGAGGEKLVGFTSCICTFIANSLKGVARRFSQPTTKSYAHALPLQCSGLRMLETSPPVIVVVLVVPEAAQMVLRARLIDLCELSLRQRYSTRIRSLASHVAQEHSRVNETHILNLPWRQLERHRPQVITQPLLLPTRRNRHHILIHTPPQTNLSGTDRVLLRQTLQHRLARRTLRSLRHRRQRAVRRRRDTFAAVVGEQVRVLQVGVELDLVDGGRNRAGFEDVVEVLGQVIRDADRASQTLLLQGLHLRPFGLVLGLALAEEGRVDQVQIDVVGLQLLQAGRERGGDVGDVGQDFCGEEDFVARDGGGGDGGAELGFGFVDFGAVEVRVAEAYGEFGGVDAGLVEFGFVAGFVPGGAGAVAELGGKVVS